MLVKLLKQIGHFFAVISILTILFLLTVLIALPVYPFRFILSKCAKYFRPGLGKILSAKSSLPGVDLSDQPKQSMIIYFIGKGEPDFERVKQFGLDNIIYGKDANGQLSFSELQQYVVRCCGFLFWKWDRTFDVMNHIRVINNAEDYNRIVPGLSAGVKDVITEEMMYDAGSLITYCGFKAKRSPWEMIYFPSIRTTDKYAEDEEGSKYFGVVMRIHHCLADGMSLTKALNVNLAGKDSINVQRPTFVPVMPKMNICKKIAMLFKAPYDFISESILAYDGLNDWHIPEEKLKRKHNSMVSPIIPMSYIKEIKNHYHCSFTTVIISAFAGAIRRFMVESGYDKNVPEVIHCIHPLPMPHHPDKLRNHMTACFIALPVGITNPQQRLMSIEDSLLRAKDSTLYPIALYYYMCLLGAFPACIIKLFAKNTLCTGFMSNFPGNQDELQILEYKLKSMYFAGGFTAGNLGMGFASISYNGSIRVVAGVDEGIVSSDKLPASVFLNYFMDELDKLKREAV